MTDEDKIEAVAATLVGSFYVGQRVRTTLGSEGIVAHIKGKQPQDWFYISFAGGTCLPYAASELTPL